MAGAAGIVLGLVVVGAVLACTTALPPRQITDYRAATPVVLGTVATVGPMEITVRVEVAYRGSVGRSLALETPGPAAGWCAFPWGPPAVGSRVLVAVVDQQYWQWPNSSVWLVDGDGRILGPPEAPWIGAPAPTTVAEALRSMGIAPPDTSTQPLVDRAWGGRLSDTTSVLSFVIALASSACWLRRRTRDCPPTTPDA